MRYVLAITCLLAVSCAAPPEEGEEEAPRAPAGQEEAMPAGESDPAAVREAIEAQNADIVRWVAAGQIDSAATIFAEDAVQMPPNDEALVGRDAIREYWTEAAGWGRWEFELNTEDVAVSGPMAVERGTFVLTFTAGPDAPPDMPSFQDRGNYLVHWRREADGVWRIVADAPVSELPLPTPPAR